MPVPPVAATWIVIVVALLSLAATTDSADAKARRGAFKGVTSQGYAGYLKTSAGGFLIDKASIPVEVTCTDGSKLLLPQTFELVVVKPNGRFRESGEGSSVEEGVSVRISETLSGRFNRNHTRVTTRSRTYASVHFPDGTFVTCDSGPVTMRAHR
jgi:hypothetical protein